jgi:hypothetical protein
LIPGRFWCVFFILLACSFIADTYFVIKGMRRTGSRSVDVLMFLIFLSLPYFTFLMLKEEQLTMVEKVIDSSIAFICVVAGIVNLYVAKRRRG